MTEEIFRNDTPEFEFTLKDSAGAALDLTNATEVRFMAKPEREADVTDALAQFNRTCSIDAPATAGICRVTLTVTDTNKGGRFIAEVQIKFTSGAVNTADQFLLVIKTDVILA